MSFKCPFCKDPDVIIPRDKEQIAEHLCVFKFRQGDDSSFLFHVHGPIDNKVVIQEFVEYILKESGIAFSVVPGRPAEDRTSEKK